MKKYLTTNNIIAFLVFLTSLIVYLLTFQRTVPYWDCGEFIATGTTLGVPHSPGAPFHTLLGRIFIMLFPLGDNPAIRMNFLSVLTTALTVMFLYLVIVSVLFIIKKGSKSLTDQIVIYGSSIIGAFSYAFNGSTWFSAVEAEVYAPSMFFFIFVVWLALKWYLKPPDTSNHKYILMMGYLIGLSIGIHQLSLLCYFFVAWLVYFKIHETITTKNLFVFCVSAPLLFFLIYPGIIEWLPSMLDGSIDKPVKVLDSDFLRILPAILVAALIYGIYYTYKHKKVILNIGFSVLLLVLIGYSTYLMVPIRANDNPPINMGNPANTQSFLDYMERKQYGEAPPIFKRRWRQEPEYQKNYKTYKSDWDYFWKYQLDHMYFRYFGWNFIGKSGDVQDAPVVWFKDTPGWAKMKGWPQKYYAIPFIIGLLGLFYHFRKDWKTAIAFLSLFLVSGLVLVLYFNMAQPQPRERDYFFIGSFMVFAFWIGLGVTALSDFISEYSKKTYLISAVIGIMFAIIPVNMLVQNYHGNDRSLNYSAFDSGYNMLQSCKKDAILFTGGDNDTYPLWYLQNAEGVRRDVRIVNLSLINTEWYIYQQKHDDPFGAKKVPISFSDPEIKSLSDNYFSQHPPQPMTLPTVPKEKWSEYGITDSNQIKDMKFTMPVYAEFRGQKVIRLQDVIINDIVMTNKWERPIYFALTSPSKDMVGLDSFLEMQGMGLEITPVKKSGSRFNLNEKIIDEQLLAENVFPSKETQRGFLFRNLDNPNLNIEEQAQDIIQTYRALYTMAARDLIQKNNRDKAKRYLDVMEKKIPVSVMPMSYNLLLDVIDLCAYLNDDAKVNFYAKFAEEEAQKMISTNPRDMENLNILAMIYERKKEYDKAIGVYKKFLDANPNDQNVKGRIAYLQAMMASDTTKKDTTKK